MRIFISYRREDTAGYAGRLYDRLTGHFGMANVFMDVDAIGPGQNFVEAIEDAVGGSDALIALIGQDWLTIQDAAGARRLENLEDFVRLEIAEAIERGILVIPVLVESASVPSQDELPGPLKPLSVRNALELSDTRFHQDVDRLIKALEEHGANLEIAEASVEPPELDDELGARLEKLYTQGLSAFWMEDWEKAVRNFRAVAEVHPDYEEVASRLAEAERKAEAKRLFTEAQSAYDAEHWPEAAAAFETLIEFEPNYEGVSENLERARGQLKIASLYSEAQRLFKAEAWQAVLTVFDQIKALDPRFADPENLESQASKALADEERAVELEALYGRAVRALDAGEDREARSLLLELRRKEPGYRDADQLLERLGAAPQAETPPGASRGTIRSWPGLEDALESRTTARPRRSSSSFWVGLISSGGAVTAILVGGAALCLFSLFILPSFPAEPTRTPTLRVTATKTPTPTVTLTPSITPTQTITPTPTITRTPTTAPAQLTAEALAEVAATQTAEVATAFGEVRSLIDTGFVLSNPGYFEWTLVSHEVEYDSDNGWAVRPLGTTSTANFVVKSEVIWESASGDAGCGFVFHVGNGSDSAIIYRDGTFSLSYEAGEDRARFTGDAPDVNTENGDRNTILLIVVGPNAELYVNGRFVARGDNATKRAGYVAPAAFGDIRCTYDDGWLWIIP